MKLLKLPEKLYGCLVWAAVLTGCTFEAGLSTSPPPPDISGSITVRWTIAGTTAPAQCAYYEVDSLSLVVYDESGSPLVKTNAPCEAFSVRVELSPGVYHADATLVDVNERPRSLTLKLDDLQVTTGTDLAVDIDFPARSIL